jgi:hypothetical protein
MTNIYQIITGASAGIALILGTVGTAQAQNIITNGSFEMPTLPGGQYTGSGTTSIPGWNLDINSTGTFIEVQNNAVGSAKQGSQLLELDSDGVTGIYQDLNTVPGQTYILQFAFSPRPGVRQNRLNITWGGNPVATLTADGAGLSNTQWTVYTYSLVANSTTTRLEFDNFNEYSNALGTLIDAVSVTCTCQ